jgi:hypothetical protein
MERAARPQTSGMRDVLSLSANDDLIRTNLQRSRRAPVMRILSRFAPAFFKPRLYQTPPAFASRIRYGVY